MAIYEMKLLSQQAIIFEVEANSTGEAKSTIAKELSLMQQRLCSAIHSKVIQGTTPIRVVYFRLKEE